MRSIIRVLAAGAAASSLWLAPAFATEAPPTPPATHQHAEKCTCKHAMGQQQSRQQQETGAVIDYGGYKL